MTLSETALVLIGLLLAAWTLGAGWLILSARAALRRAETGRKAARRLSRMIEECGHGHICDCRIISVLAHPLRT